MITKTEYIEIIHKITNEKTNFNKDLYYEIYSVFDLLLNQLLADSILKFTTIRSRFLFLSDRDKYSDDLVKKASQVFNKHHHLLQQDSLLREFDVKLLAYIFISTINYYLKEKITFTDTHFLKLISAYTFNKEAISQEKLDCWFKKIRRIKDKKNVVLYELTGLNENGELIKFLFLENILLNSQNTFSILFKLGINDSEKCFNCLIDLFKIDRHIRFFNVSYSEKGYFYQNFNTSFIIEPDFLLDVTAIAECFQTREIFPELFFIKFIDTPYYGLPILKGNFVNYLLDAIITESKLNLDINDDNNDFYKQLQLQFLKILKFGKGDFKQILNEINEIHLPNLKFFKDNIGKDQSQISLEPAFISEEYGLQGRLDALIESSKDKNYKTILELKSGKPHYNHLWQNNFTQVTAYNLLLKSVFGNSRTGNSILLYSKAENDPLRNVPYSQSTAEQILLCRNIIINEIFKFADDENNIVTILFKLSQCKIPIFLLSKLSDKLILFNQLRDYEILYINSLISFVMRELIAQKLSFIDESGILKYGHSSLWTHTFEEKYKQKIIIPNLKLINQEDKVFHFTVNKKSIELCSGNFREGDLIIIYPEYEKSARPTKVQLFKAVLKEINTDENKNLNILITFRNELIRFKDLTHFKSFYIEKDILESSFYSIPGSIINYFHKRPLDRDIFFGLKKPRLNKKIKNTELNQLPVFERIMTKASHFEDYLLIQGPPGTGKTSKYLMSIVKNHINLNHTSVVIVAFTNRAVEEICNKLQENEIDFLLLGTKLTEENYHINSLINNDFLKIIEILQSKPVFVSTVATFQNEGYYLKNYINTDLLIVDEASQLLESQLIGIIALFNRFILIGDHYQLPAVSVQPKLETNKILKDKIHLDSLKDSLFERLFKICEKNNWTEFYDLLPEHYRMHNEIANLVNPFYDNKLKPNHNRQFEPFNYYLPDDNNHIISQLSKSRCIFIPTINTEQIRFNDEEANKIIKIINNIYQNIHNNFSEDSIGIICTWRMQVNTIIDKLQYLPFAEKITVDTVERFQGSERDIIIYSTAVANTELLDKMQSVSRNNKIDRKLNVAISRAKEQFIMLGNKNILTQSIHYQSVITKLLEIIF
ncbi:MAG: AAA domain-containing protein [Candidatus Cloacimonetes bacterium]|nr:AAA domain-containing protein [Candidatus Cloacimonadota bacterium]